MHKIISMGENIIASIGKWSSWLNLVMVLLICADVALRYIFRLSANWIIELEWHLFGLIFLFGSAYAYQMDKHVRVDLFYTKWSKKTKAWVDIAGNIIFLIPWCMVGIITCYKYASNSLYIRERSPNPDGLPAMYIIKYCIVAGFILLLIQAITDIYRKIQLQKSV